MNEVDALKALDQGIVLDNKNKQILPLSSEKVGLFFDLKQSLEDGISIDINVDDCDTNNSGGIPDTPFISCSAKKKFDYSLSVSFNKINHFLKQEFDKRNLDFCITGEKNIPCDKISDEIDSVSCKWSAPPEIKSIDDGSGKRFLALEVSKLKCSANVFPIIGHIPLLNSLITKLLTEEVFSTHVQLTLKACNKGNLCIDTIDMNTNSNIDTSSPFSIILGTLKKLTLIHPLIMSSVLTSSQKDVISSMSAEGINIPHTKVSETCIDSESISVFMNFKPSVKEVSQEMLDGTGKTITP